MGPNSLFRMGTIFGFSSILKSKICAAKLYSKGDGLSPCACPFSSVIESEKMSPPSIIFAVLPVPIVASHLRILSPNPKKEYTFSMKECPTESNALDWSIATNTPLMLFFLQYEIFWSVFNMTSCNCLALLKPFCARLRTLFATFFSLLFIAREIIL